MNPINASQEHEYVCKMPPELGRLYGSIETQKAQMLACLEAMTGEQQRSRPSPSEWSPLQVLDHVVIVEEWIAGPNAAPLPANAKVRLKGHLFLAFGGSVMRFGLRVPTLTAAKPQENLDSSVIKHRWGAVREALAPKLSAITRETQHHPIALHPVAGPLDAGQFLRLLDVHLAYHLRHFPDWSGAAGISAIPAE